MIGGWGVRGLFRKPPAAPVVYKPRIVRRNGQWLCDEIAYGATPKIAYDAWKNFQHVAQLLIPPMDRIKRT